MFTKKGQSALKQDAYKILSQLKIESLEPRIFQTALSFAIGSGDQHVLIGLMKSYPELLGQDSVFSKTVYESIRLNPDSAESVYLKALADLQVASKKFSKEETIFASWGLKDVIARKNNDLKHVNFFQTKLDAGNFVSYEETRLVSVKCDNARRQAMKKLVALKDYGEIEKSFIDASKAFEFRAIYGNKSPDRLVDWAYSQMALREVGLAEANKDKMESLCGCRFVHQDDWGIKYALLEMKDKNVRNNPYASSVLGEEYKSNINLSEDELEDMCNFSDEAYQAIYLGRRIRVEYSPNENDGEGSDLIG